MRGKRRSWLVTVGVTAALIACGPLVAHSDRGGVDEWLKSEHSLMKKRITFLERENSVLAKENAEKAEQLKQLKADLALLQSELADWKIRYLRQTETLTAELNETLDENASIAEESERKIRELESIHEASLRSCEDKIEALNDRLAQQAKAFDREREALRKAAEEKQAALSQRIEDLSREVASRDAVIESLKAHNEGLSGKFESCMKEVGEKTLSLHLLQAEVEKLKGVPETPRDASGGIPSGVEANGP
jgi:chromosome segregation ATPase